MMAEVDRCWWYVPVYLHSSKLLSEFGGGITPHTTTPLLSPLSFPLSPRSVLPCALLWCCMNEYPSKVYRNHQPNQPPQNWKQPRILLLYHTIPIKSNQLWWKRRYLIQCNVIQPKYLTPTFFQLPTKKLSRIITCSPTLSQFANDFCPSTHWLRTNMSLLTFPTCFHSSCKRWTVISMLSEWRWWGVSRAGVKMRLEEREKERSLWAETPLQTDWCWDGANGSSPYSYPFLLRLLLGPPSSLSNTQQSMHPFAYFVELKRSQNQKLYLRGLLLLLRTYLNT